MSLTQSNGQWVQKPQYDTIPRKGEMSHIIPRFFTKQVETDGIDPATSLKVFRAVEYVELLIPGDSKNKVHKRVNDQIKQQFAVEYRQFKESGENADMVGDGIPLDLWGGVSKEQVIGLKHVHIYTVQHLAGLSDDRLSQPGLMGLRALRDKASQYLAAMKDAAPVAALQKQIDALQAQLEMRDKQIAEALALASQQRTPSQEQLSDTPPVLTTPRGRRKQGDDV